MKPLIWISAIVPLLLLGAALLLFISQGPPGVLSTAFPPVEKIFIERVVLEHDQLTLHVINDGPSDLSVSQVLINDAFWQFSMEPESVLKPREKARIKLAYPWVFADELHIGVLSGTGLLFEKTIPVATLTPVFNIDFLQTFVLLGVYVGVMPVLFGLLWLPFMRSLGKSWKNFMLSLTVGLLVFLGIDALAGAFNQLANVPSVYNGLGIIVLGFFLAIFILGAVSKVTQNMGGLRNHRFQALMFAYLVALAIGLHNLGEGLAIGSAYAVGEIALGSLLVIGFMVHNLTEGIAIVSPLTRAKAIDKGIIIHLIGIGLIAGAPTIVGTIIGGFSYSAALSVFFLALGAGAIFDVSFDLAAIVAGKNWLSLFSFENIAGFLCGFAVIYLTGFLIVA